VGVRAAASAAQFRGQQESCRKRDHEAKASLPVPWVESPHCTQELGKRLQWARTLTPCAILLSPAPLPSTEKT
jgi:hypothetical protein